MEVAIRTLLLLRVIRPRARKNLLLTLKVVVIFAWNPKLRVMVTLRKAARRRLLTNLWSLLARPLLELPRTGIEALQQVGAFLEKDLHSVLLTRLMALRLARLLFAIIFSWVAALRNSMKVLSNITKIRQIAIIGARRRALIVLILLICLRLRFRSQDALRMAVEVLRLITLRLLIL